MINFGGGIPFFLGIFLVLCGVALYALRSYRPQLSRDHDIFFAAISAISGFILMFQGWQLNPILQLGQVAIAGSAVFFVVENLRLRGITTEQAKRRTPIVDDERAVSQEYDYEQEEDYDSRRYRYRSEFESAPADSRTRRIPSGRSARVARDEWEDDYRDAPRRMPPRRDWQEEAPYDYEERPRKRRLPRSRRRVERMEEPTVVDATWDEAPRPAVADRDPSDRPDRYRAIPPSREDSRDRYANATPIQAKPTFNDEAPVTNGSYANYRPSDEANSSDDEEDNSGYQDFY